MRKFIVPIGALLILLIPTFVAAQQANPCTYVGGCHPQHGYDIIFKAIQVLASFFTSMAAGASILFVVYGGALMMLSFGDESKISNGKNAVAFALIGFALTLGAQIVVGFAVARLLAFNMQGQAFVGIQIMKMLVQTMLIVFNTTFAIVAIISGVRLVLSRGKSDEFEAVKKSIVWVIGGAMVVNFAHVVVRAIFAMGFGGVTLP